MRHDGRNGFEVHRHQQPVEVVAAALHLKHAVGEIDTERARFEAVAHVVEFDFGHAVQAEEHAGPSDTQRFGSRSQHILHIAPQPFIYYRLICHCISFLVILYAKLRHLKELSKNNLEIKSMCLNN